MPWVEFQSWASVSALVWEVYLGRLTTVQWDKHFLTLTYPSEVVFKSMIVRSSAQFQGLCANVETFMSCSIKLSTAYRPCAVNLGPHSVLSSLSTQSPVLITAVRSSADYALTRSAPFCPADRGVLPGAGSDSRADSGRLRQTAETDQPRPREGDQRAGGREMLPHLRQGAAQRTRYASAGERRGWCGVAAGGGAFRRIVIGG